MGASNPRPWRQVCEEALRKLSGPEAIRFWRMAHEDPRGPQPVFDYRYEHTLAAVKISRWLAPQVGADPEVVECAAWLHDCTKRYLEPKGHDSHAHEASEQVSAILGETDFPADKVPAVRHAIEHHVGLRLTRRLEPVETACLWDADKLSKLGAASLVHYCCISGAFQPIDTALILERGQRWLDLAQGIVASMNTEPARKEAARRMDFLIRHYHQLSREWNEPMEETLP